MDDKGSKFYYSRLTDGGKFLYDKICGAFLRFEPGISLHAGMGKPFSVDITKILEAVIFDNPVFFYVNRNRIIIQQSPMYIQLHFQYTHEKAEAEALWAQVEAKVSEFIQNQIKPGMSPLAKQIQIHKYISTIQAAQPPYDKEHFSIVGALLNRKCVCEGYAKAYKLLCDRVGIASIVVLGDALCPDGKKEPHAWNITRINGVTAHNDVCWDAQYGISCYDYFNLCDADISADHVFDASMYPKCDPNTINYFYKNNRIAADEAQLDEIIAAQWKENFITAKLLFPISESQLRAKMPDLGHIRFNKALNIFQYVRVMYE